MEIIRNTDSACSSGLTAITFTLSFIRDTHSPTQLCLSSNNSVVA